MQNFPVDEVERGGQLIESNIEPLAERNRIEQRDKFKRSRRAYSISPIWQNKLMPLAI